MQTRQKLAERNARLLATAEGKALHNLIRDTGSQTELAEVLGVHRDLVGSWVFKGRVSPNGARMIEQILGVNKEDMRPDMTADDWAKSSPGQKIGGNADRTGADRELLADLASHFGSVRDLCKKAGFKVGDYHTWKSRDRIPAHAVQALTDIDLPKRLRKRVGALTV